MKKVIENYGPSYLHSVAGAAARMGISRNTMNDLIAEGLIVPIMMPGAKREKIAEWQLEECERKLIGKNDYKVRPAAMVLQHLAGGKIK